MIKKTYQDLFDLDQIVARMYEKNPKLKDTTKFGYGYTRFYEKNLRDVFSDYYVALEDLRIDNALEDKETKAVIRDRNDPRGFKYTKDGLRKTIAAERLLVKEWNLKEFEVEPYFITPENLPKDLTDEQKEAFLGVLTEVL